MPSPSQILPGHVFGKYTLIKPLGEGGYGGVWLAEHTTNHQQHELRRRVALKLRHRHESQTDMHDANLSFLRDWYVGNLIQHPNVIKIEEVVTSGPDIAIVMEWVDGLTFADIIRRVAGIDVFLPQAAVLEAGIGVCAGLRALHNAKASDGTPYHIVHRDIKPPNLMIDHHGVVRVLDLGIAKSEELPGDKTAHGIAKGTREYMAPEQYLSANLSPATDLYSLGAVLFELATKERLFRADAEDSYLFKRKRSGHAAGRITAHEALLGPLAPILRRCLAIEADERPQSAEELLQALQALLDGSPRGPGLRELMAALRGDISPRMGQSPEWAPFALALDCPRRPTPVVHLPRQNIALLLPELDAPQTIVEELELIDDDDSSSLHSVALPAPAPAQRPEVNRSPAPRPTPDEPTRSLAFSPAPSPVPLAGQTTRIRPPTPTPTPTPPASTPEPHGIRPPTPPTPPTPTPPTPTTPPTTPRPPPGAAPPTPPLVGAAFVPIKAPTPPSPPPRPTPLSALQGPAGAALTPPAAPAGPLNGADDPPALPVEDDGDRRPTLLILLAATMVGVMLAAGLLVAGQVVFGREEPDLKVPVPPPEEPLPPTPDPESLKFQVQPAPPPADPCDGVPDEDGDGFLPCVPTGANGELKVSDCDDKDAKVYPSAKGDGRGVDNNCDGKVEGKERLVSVPAPPPLSCFEDFDGDGYGNPGRPLQGEVCRGKNVSKNSEDCHDGKSDWNPKALEQPGDPDKNCDGEFIPPVPAPKPIPSPNVVETPTGTEKGQEPPREGRGRSNRPAQRAPN